MCPRERSHERIHPRHAIELSLQVSRADGQGQAATSIDIALGGVRMSTSPALGFGEAVTVRFRLPALDQDTVVEGVVRWTDGEVAGVQFGSLRARDVWGLNQLFRGA